jgi:hypothetical protein
MALLAVEKKEKDDEGFEPPRRRKERESTTRRGLTLLIVETKRKHNKKGFPPSRCVDNKEKRRAHLVPAILHLSSVTFMGPRQCWRSRREDQLSRTS